MVISDLIASQIKECENIIHLQDEEYQRANGEDLQRCILHYQKAMKTFWQNTLILLMQIDNSKKNEILEIWNIVNTPVEQPFTFNAYRDRMCQYIKHLKIIDKIVNHNDMEKTPLLFISHSSTNENFVSELVKLMEFLKLDSTTMFCSSLPGYGIPTGADIYDYLRECFVRHDIFVIFVHSNEFYGSHASLNEMGAAWVLKSRHASFLVPGFDLNKMDGAVNNKEMAIVIDSTKAWDKINSLKDQIVEFFNLAQPNGSAWEVRRNEFLNNVRK